MNAMGGFFITKGVFFPNHT